MGFSSVSLALPISAPLSIRKLNKDDVFEYTGFMHFCLPEVLEDSVVIPPKRSFITELECEVWEIYGIFIGSVLQAIVQFNHISLLQWDIHILSAKSCRGKRLFAAIEKIIALFTEEHPPIYKVLCATIPTCFKGAIWLAKQLGGKSVGKIPKSFLKNKELFDKQIFHLELR